jgi:hypothetical protein
MTSHDSSKRPGSGVAEPLAPNLVDQRAVRPDPPVRSVEELVEFLMQVEAVVGRDERPRRPIVGDHFRL